MVLDSERGYWARNEAVNEDDPADAMSRRTSRVTPYVQDRRNSLLLSLTDPLDATAMASLQAALKNAIQVVYQLEDNELAAEPLPREDDLRLLLFYESAEGGAGVLHRLLDDPKALARVAREALCICHFDPETGEDQRRSPGAREDCEAACYDCLMSYYNQRDHRLLDRTSIFPVLSLLAGSAVEAGATALPRAEQLRLLLDRAGSELERDWLRFIEAHGLALPSASQILIERASTRPDFLYEEQGTAVYIDGPVHDYPYRQARDIAVMEAMGDLGYVVLRFGHRDDWASTITKHPSVFGTFHPLAAQAQTAGQTAKTETDGPDLDLYPETWHHIIVTLTVTPGVSVSPGGDLLGPDGTVTGNYVALVRRGPRALRLVEADTPPVADAGPPALSLDPGAPDAPAAVLRAQEGDGWPRSCSLTACSSRVRR